MDTERLAKIHDENMTFLDEAIHLLHSMKNLSEDKKERKQYKQYANAARYAYSHLGKERPMYPSYYGWCNRCGGDLMTKGKSYDYCPWCGQKIAKHIPLSYEIYRPEITRFYNEEESYDIRDNYISRDDEPINEQPYELPECILDAFNERKDNGEESGEYDGWEFNED